MLDLNGKIAVVTGASRGIGKGIAKRLHEAGADVVLAARSMDALEAVSGELGGAMVVSMETSAL